MGVSWPHSSSLLITVGGHLEAWGTPEQAQSHNGDSGQSLVDPLVQRLNWGQWCVIGIQDNLVEAKSKKIRKGEQNQNITTGSSCANGK